MPNYNCNICGFSTKIKTNYLQHLKTKKHIKNVKNYGIVFADSLQNPPKPSKNPPKPSDFGGKKCTNIFERTISKNINPYIFSKLKNTEPEIFYCKYCSKSFSRQDNLKRHMDYRCKEKHKMSNESIFKDLYEKEVKEKELFMEEHKKHVEKLLDKVGYTTINNNCNNTRTTTQTNNQTNVQLNNYGQENLEMLTDKYMRKMIIYPYTAIPKMIKKIHFNDKFPENRNIRMLNKKDNKLQIRNNNKWEYVNKKETLESLINDKNYQLDRYYEENRDSFEHKYQNRFDGFQGKIMHDDKVLNKHINTDTELIFWNNM